MTSTQVSSLVVLDLELLQSRIGRTLTDFQSVGRQTEMNAEVEGTGDDQDFLARERAALGDDAAQFASANDNAATVEDGDDDLLGGGGDYNGNNAQLGGEEMSGFESSFPAVDSANEVDLPKQTHRESRC